MNTYLKKLEKVVTVGPSFLLFIIFAIGTMDIFSSQTVYIFAILAFLATYNLNNEKWYGSLAGISMGVISIYLDRQETMPKFDMTNIYILIIIYYIVIGVYLLYKRIFK